METKFNVHVRTSYLYPPIKTVSVRGVSKAIEIRRKLVEQYPHHIVSIEPYFTTF